MKIVGSLLLASVVLAALQFAVMAFLLMLAVMLVWGVYARPQQTFGLLTMLLLFGLVDRQPLACVLVAGLAFVIVKIADMSAGEAGRNEGR